MKASFFFCVASLLLTQGTRANAQEWDDGMLDDEPFMSARNQTWYWAGKNYVYEGEHIWTILMPELPVYKPLVFKNKKEQERYNKLVYNVRRVLPLAQQVNVIIKEAYLVLEELPDKKSKDAHVKKV